METLFKDAAFGLILSIAAYNIGLFIYKRTKNPFCNPLLIAVVIIISFLKISGVDYSSFEIGSSLIFFFLAPATVILAVPLYKQSHVLKKNALAVLGGILSGSITAVISVILLSRAFGLNKEIILSLVPKSITTPIGIELSKSLGGIVSVTVASIVITGILGAAIAPVVLKLFRITHPVAKGIAIGTSAHAVGTSKAVEMGEVEGAISGLSIGLAGIITVVVAPLIWYFMG